MIDISKFGIGMSGIKEQGTNQRFHAAMYLRVFLTCLETIILEVGCTTIRGRPEWDSGCRDGAGSRS